MAVDPRRCAAAGGNLPPVARAVLADNCSCFARPQRTRQCVLDARPAAQVDQLTCRCRRCGGRGGRGGWGFHGCLRRLGIDGGPCRQQRCRIARTRGCGQRSGVGHSGCGGNRGCGHGCSRERGGNCGGHGRSVGRGLAASEIAGYVGQPIGGGVRANCFLIVAKAQRQLHHCLCQRAVARGVSHSAFGHEDKPLAGVGHVERVDGSARLFQVAIGGEVARNRLGLLLGGGRIRRFTVSAENAARAKQQRNQQQPHPQHETQRASSWQRVRLVNLSGGSNGE